MRGPIVGRFKADRAMRSASVESIANTWVEQLDVSVSSVFAWKNDEIAPGTRREICRP
jgi:hypothetical protein